MIHVLVQHVTPWVLHRNGRHREWRRGFYTSDGAYREWTVTFTDGPTPNLGCRSATS